MKQTPVISVRNLTIGYPKSKKHPVTSLYKDLSFDLYSGELTSLLGSNGAGKSTLLRTLTGLQKPLDGTVLLHGKDIQEYTEQELATHIGLVLTDKTISGGLTVFDLVALGRYPYTGFFGKLSSKDYSTIQQALLDVDIYYKKDEYVAELSDGERQKVMIAKALAQECSIIILDEPTAFLDVVNRIEITNLLHKLTYTKNKTILLSTHDIDLAFRLSDKLWLLSRDKGFKLGNTEDILFSDSINQFLGRKNIQFDNSIGTFSINHEFKSEILLDVEHDYYYWTKNFLERNQIQIVDTTNKNTPRLKVISPSELELIIDDRMFKLESFLELKDFLEKK